MLYKFATGNVEFLEDDDAALYPKWPSPIVLGLVGQVLHRKGIDQKEQHTEMFAEEKEGFGLTVLN